MYYSDAKRKAAQFFCMIVTSADSAAKKILTSNLTWPTSCCNGAYDVEL